MNTSFTYALLSASLLACHTGNFNESCNKDGTCNSSNLICNQVVCIVKEAPSPPRRCFYESECLCVTCSEKCGEAGVKECVYSDTSVWGAKPSACECK
jgi:hypothetical protein